MLARRSRRRTSSVLREACRTSIWKRSASAAAPRARAAECASRHRHPSSAVRGLLYLDDIVSCLWTRPWRSRGACRRTCAARPRRPRRGVYKRPRGSLRARSRRNRCGMNMQPESQAAANRRRRRGFHAGMYAARGRDSNSRSLTELGPMGARRLTRDGTTLHACRSVIGCSNGSSACWVGRCVRLAACGLAADC